MSDAGREYVCDASQSSHTLAAVFGRWGLLKLSRSFSPDLLLRVRSAADAIYEGRDRLLAANQSPPEKERHQYRRRTIRLGTLAIDGATAGDMLSTPLLREIAETYLHRPAVRSELSSVRSMVPGPQALPLAFHQDQTIMQRPVVNVWIPLSDCGIVSPSLEIAVTGGRNKALETSPLAGSDIPADRARIEDATVLEEFGGDSLWRPAFQIGDVLVFNGMTPHRTYLTAQMTEPRLSCELRFV